MLADLAVEGRVISDHDVAIHPDVRAAHSAARAASHTSTSPFDVDLVTTS